MKLHSLGKRFGLVIVLTFVLALTFALAVSADTSELASQDYDNLYVRVTGPYSKCSDIQLSWDEVAGAVKYAVYVNDTHEANSLIPQYVVSDLKMAKEGEEDIVHTFKIMALDEANNVLALGTATAVAEHYYTVVTTDPTCLDNGSTVYTCTCGHSYSEEIKALGHEFVNYVPDGDAYCLADGHETAKCERCDVTDTRVDVGSSVGAHKNVAHVAKVNSKCFTPGNIEYWICNDCGGMWLDIELTKPVTPADVVIAPAHTNVAHVEAVEPTCHTEGNNEYWICYGCETMWQDEARTKVINKKDVELSALGGNIIYVEAKASTCTETGHYEYWYCEECDRIWRDGALTRLTSLSAITTGVARHTKSSVTIENIVDYTCTEDGSHDEVIYCTVCSAEVERNTIVDKATGHYYLTYLSNNDADCLNDGTKTAKCNNGCGKTDTVEDVGSALGHDYRLVESVEAFCNVEGVAEHYHCDRCGNDFDIDKNPCDVASLTTPKIDHNWVLQESKSLITENKCDMCGGTVDVINKSVLTTVLIVAGCLLVVILCIFALTDPATTTPWFRRGKYR